MEGIISSFKRAKHSQTPNQMIIQVKGVTTKEKAKDLVGKEAVWESPAKKQIKGKVKAPHGNSGSIRILFEKGMPGQSLGSKVKLS
ncbi:50S ribosomal protein L35ae [Nanoarchaeota archaeon]